MKRFCLYNGKLIPPDRVRRGSLYCTDECRQLARKEERNAKGLVECRLCGRPINGRFQAMVKTLKAIAKGRISHAEMVGLARTIFEPCTKGHGSKAAKRN